MSADKSALLFLAEFLVPDESGAPFSAEGELVRIAPSKELVFLFLVAEDGAALCPAERAGEALY